MLPKDYYKTLQVPYNASQDDIRKAFRSLAFIHHPDKNNGEPQAEETFKEIQEAYFILSDIDRREEYHLKSRYPLLNKREKAKPITPKSILERCKKLDAHVANLDMFRMSKEILFQQIMHLIADENIDLLLRSGDEATNQQIIAILMHCAKPLGYEYIEKIHTRLARLAGANGETIQQIHHHTKEKKRASYWDKYNGLIILILTVLICLFIWLSGK